MSTILAYVAALFQPVVTNILTRLMGAFAAIMGEQPIDQQQILHDAIGKFTADRTAGNSYGEAAADALDTYFNAEKGEVNKVTLSLFNAFLAAMETSTLPAA